MMVQSRRLARTVCPDDEALAQLIDGLCHGGTRSQLLSHLEGFALCSKLYIESQLFVYTKFHPAGVASSSRSGSS